MSGNPSHGGHIDAAGNPELFSQQSPCFASAGVCSREASGFNASRQLEYGHNDIYQASQPNQQFQPGSTPFVQRPLHPSLPQNPSNHFSFPKPTIQQHPQHPYTHPYSVPSQPDGGRRFVADEQWRINSNEFTADNQHGMWMAGRTPSHSGPPFVQEGYFRPPLERPPSSNMGFQLPAAGNLPAGVAIPGHGVSQLLPCRPDMSALNCWRPA
ncbi:ENHANCER OF AG-4 protein 2-like [Carica papaya]|uniref:ENHANCER OF AG-4 protein 2-like n=1 Tax=Carica papaya TaxID=3649 RepID=UPI000B8CA853|nr:ENHANCER OF AG-4 protein 2-like [Carica papaya]